MTPPIDIDPDALHERRRQVLRLVVRHHVETGEPVGSRLVAEHHAEGLSPASIRNIMAELEDEGLLTHPHPSAGRVPTDKGYRFFVDSLLDVGRIQRGEAARIEAALRAAGGEIRTTLEEASRVLSTLSRSVGVAVSPDLASTIFEHIEFVRIQPRRVVAIFVARSGVVHHRVLDLDEDHAQEDLDRLAGLVVRRFSGHTLPEVRRELLELMSREKAGLDRMLAEALRLTQRYLELAEPGSRVFVGGAAALLEAPEFADRERLGDLLVAFEEKGRLVGILNRCLESRGVTVQIGSENPEPEMAGCSVVVSPYGPEGRPVGTVGIIGPTRMEYARAVALVEHVARCMSVTLSRNEEDGS